MSNVDFDISALSPEERLNLIEKLWDSLASDPSSVPFTEAQRNEIDFRLDAMERGEGENVPLDEALNRIRTPRDNRHT